MNKDNLKDSVDKIDNPLKDVNVGNDMSNTMPDNYDQKHEKAEIPRGGDTKSGTRWGKRSLFNPYHLFTGDGTNDFIYTDDDFKKKRDDLRPTFRNLLRNRKDGANNYDETDFLYCKNNHISNYNLITLRRFPYPCFDDIFGSVQTEPDIGRLVSYSTQETNPLSDLMSFSYGLSYKELESTFEEISLIGDSSGESGVMKSLLKIVDPVGGQNALRNPNEMAYDRHSDANKVWGDVDVIKKMFIRDKGLNFEQEISVNFDYTLASYNGVNPRTAMIDLMSHVLAVTYNNGKFWGGGRYYTGARRSTYGNKLRKGGREFMNEMKKSNISFTGLASSLNINSDNILDTAKSVLTNISKLGFGKLLDVAGRSSVPVMNSLLTGEQTGEWHLTIGNPLRPTMAIGNLILSNTEISILDETLGADGFPTTIRVTCTLKHAMPRDKAGIESMFNSGKGRTYFKPTDETLKDMVSGTKKKNSLRNKQSKDIEQVVSNAFDFVQKKFS